jgi:hypothetical protein
MFSGPAFLPLLLLYGPRAHILPVQRARKQPGGASFGPQTKARNPGAVPLYGTKAGQRNSEHAIHPSKFEQTNAQQNFEIKTVHSTKDFVQKEKPAISFISLPNRFFFFSFQRTELFKTIFFFQSLLSTGCHESPSYPFTPLSTYRKIEYFCPRKRIKPGNEDLRHRSNEKNPLLKHAFKKSQH